MTPFEVPAEDMTAEDQRLIGIVRSVKYGEITVKIQASVPIMVEKGIMRIKLESSKGQK
jgi:hypothetical protein